MNEQERDQGNNTAEQVRHYQHERRTQSERLKAEGKSLGEIVSAFDNDYSPLEKLYKERTGVALIADPYESNDHPVPITKSCSIVIPAYNSGDQLRASLESIRAS